MGRIGLSQRSARAAAGRWKRPVFVVWLCALLLVTSLSGCVQGALAPSSSIEVTPAPAGATEEPLGLASQTLGSLQRVDEHPLYVMHYYDDYGASARLPEDMPGAACSLFAALGDPDHLFYGRNFDWEHSPALLLYTYPSDGYASISMVNLGFLGFDRDEAQNLLSLSERELEPLLRAPLLPIDGMNEVGLAVGMAAVPWSEDGTDPTRPSIGSLGIMRQMLDRAASVDEALVVMEEYTIEFAGGPPIHYLIADAMGRAVLVEYGTGRRHVMPNEDPWHLATNFLVEAQGEGERSGCDRYIAMAEELEAAQGTLSAEEAMALLGTVSQEGTQWSSLYMISDRALHLVMGRRYGVEHTFRIERSAP